MKHVTHSFFVFLLAPSAFSNLQSMETITTETKQLETPASTSPAFCVSPSPTEEEALQTLRILVDLYQKSPSPAVYNPQINAYLTSIMQRYETPKTSSRYFAKMLGLLAVGSFFDKDLAKGLSDSIASFVAMNFGPDLGFFPSHSRTWAWWRDYDPNREETMHEIVLKYAKYIVGLGIACVLTWLLVKAINQWLNAPAAFPKISAGIKLPFVSGHVSIGGNQRPKNSFGQGSGDDNSEAEQTDTESTEQQAIPPSPIHIHMPGSHATLGSRKTNKKSNQKSEL